MEIAVVGGLARIESLSSALETVTVSMSAIAIRYRSQRSWDQTSLKLGPTDQFNPNEAREKR